MMSTDFRGIVEPRYAEGGLNKMREDTIAPADVKEWDNPTLLEQLRDRISGRKAWEEGGQRPSYAREQFANGLYNMLSLLPGTGQVDSAQRMKRALNHGDYLEGGLESLGIIPATKPDGMLVKGAEAIVPHETMVNLGLNVVPNMAQREYADGGSVTDLDPNPAFAAGGAETIMDHGLSQVAQNGQGYANGGNVSGFHALDQAMRHALGRK